MTDILMFQAGGGTCQGAEGPLYCGAPAEHDCGEKRTCDAQLQGN